jgi:hypothetical protein
MEPVAITEELPVQESVTDTIENEETVYIREGTLINSGKLQIRQRLIIHLSRRHFPITITTPSKLVTIAAISVVPVLKIIKNAFLLSQ